MFLRAFDIDENSSDQAGLSDTLVDSYVTFSCTVIVDLVDEIFS